MYSNVENQYENSLNYVYDQSYWNNYNYLPSNSAVSTPYADYYNYYAFSGNQINNYDYTYQYQNTSSPKLTYNYNYTNVIGAETQSNVSSYTSSSAATSLNNSVECSPKTANSSLSSNSAKMVLPSQSNNVQKRSKAHHHQQLPEEAVDILNDWFETHHNHPYPSTEEKHRLADQCGITVKQVNSWFCNRRNRSQNTKPKRIKRQLEQEISNVFNELVANPNKAQVIDRFRSTLKMHDISITNL